MTRKLFFSPARHAACSCLAVLLAAPTLFPASASAQSFLAECGGIVNDQERLSCYDRVFKEGDSKGKDKAAPAPANPSANLPVVEVPRVGAAAPSSPPAQPRQPAPQSTGTVATSSQAPQQPASQDDFGLELKQSLNGKDDSKHEQRSVTVASASRNDFTGWTIEMKNGQVWHQVGTDDYDVKVGREYQITRGFLNSYILSNNEDNRKIRITRLK